MTIAQDMFLKDHEDGGFTVLNYNTVAMLVHPGNMHIKQITDEGIISYILEKRALYGLIDLAKKENK